MICGMFRALIFYDNYMFNFPKESLFSGRRKLSMVDSMTCIWEESFWFIQFLLKIEVVRLFLGGKESDFEIDIVYINIYLIEYTKIWVHW